MNATFSFRFSYSIRTLLIMAVNCNMKWQVTVKSKKREKMVAPCNTSAPIAGCHRNSQLLSQSIAKDDYALLV